MAAVHQVAPLFCCTPPLFCLVSFVFVLFLCDPVSSLDVSRKGIDTSLLERFRDDEKELEKGKELFNGYIIYERFLFKMFLLTKTNIQKHAII